MKFCPKCSLKIKGDLTECPICKVELLSCAEDEDVTSQFSGKDYKDQIMSEVDNIFSTENDTQNLDHIPDLNEPVKGNTADNKGQIDADADLKNRMRNLESDLKHTENKLNAILSQSDIFKGTVVDLESRISKVDHSLAEMGKDPGPSHERILRIEGEISRFALHIDQLNEFLESVKNSLEGQQGKINKLYEEYNLPIRVPEENMSEINNLGVHRERSGLFEERQAQGDLPPVETEISEEEIRFPESGVVDLENESEPFISPLSEEDSTIPERERKFPSSLIIISLLAVVIISSWLGFQYLKSQRQNAQKEIIAQRNVKAPALTSRALDAPPKIIKSEPAQKAKIKDKNLSSRAIVKKSSQVRKPAPVSRAANKKLSSPSKKSKAKRVASSRTSGYTINVGSFRDKKRAQVLTKKLHHKGYPVLISPSKKNNWYRVKVGAFSTAKEAREYAIILEKKEKLPTFISKIY